LDADAFAEQSDFGAFGVAGFAGVRGDVVCFSGFVVGSLKALDCDCFYHFFVTVYTYTVVVFKGFAYLFASVKGGKRGERLLNIILLYILSWKHTTKIR
jgi:hypothetical protein